MWTIFLIVIALVVVVGYQFRFGQPSVCLNSDDVEISLEKVNNYEQQAHINVQMHDGSRSFSISEIATMYNPIELRNCGIYVLRGFNFDYSKFSPLPGFNRSLWRYDYLGKGKKILDLAWLNDVGATMYAYDYIFRVSPNEDYLALIAGGVGAEDYGIIFQLLSSLEGEDSFRVLYKNIVGSNPNIYGSIGFNEWSSDSRYFWGNIFDGADVKAYYRIDIENKTFDVYEAPYGSLGGDALVLNPNNGYVPYDPNAYWSPDADDMAIRTAMNQEDGLKSELHLRHLPTGKDILVASVDEPLWRFSPKWISDTELEYTLPSGAKKTFVIPL